MKKNNFLIFMTDHQRGDTILDENILTPNLDKLREKSVVFTNAHCPSPHCCPSRATFFSGLYPSQHGVWNNVNVGNATSRGLFDGIKLFSEDLNENGYNLYFSGKWHISASERPSDKGFEEVYHTMEYEIPENINHFDDWDKYKEEKLDNIDTPRSEGEVVRIGYPHYLQYGNHENPFGDNQVMEAAVKKLNELKGSDEAFVLYAGPLGPHDPYNVPQRFLDMYDINDIELPKSFYDDLKDKPNLYQRTQSRYNQLTELEHKQSILHFYAFCTYEDYLFGEIMKALEESGHADDTTVMYVSDHGDYIGAHGLWAKGLPCFNEAYNVCALIGGAGVKNGGRTSDEFINLADFAPTILELASVKVDRKFAGKSFVPFLNDEETVEWRDTEYTQSNGNEVYGIQRAVYTKEWKYVFNSFDWDELYNLKDDPNEMNNLLHDKEKAKEYDNIVYDLSKKMWQFAYENDDNCVCPYIMTALAPYGPGIIFE